MPPKIIIGLADIHGDLSQISRVFADAGKVDLVVLMGDITNFGRREAAQKVIDTLRNYCQNIYAVTGNCDYPEVEDYLQECRLSLHRCCRIFQGIPFYGIYGSLPCPGRTPGEYPESHFTTGLAESAAGSTQGSSPILVTHQPPVNTKNDLAHSGEHVGSSAVRAFIETAQPPICFCGHIHEGRGIDYIGTTPILNPGPLRQGSYAYADIRDDNIAVSIRTPCRSM
ncbi:MAG: YfcE family phosphodiesterase [Deltaproteobacteria bacterium]|nr:YfcE family phosphodiesterase [Deltaproteobacteria bacterium]